MAKNPEDVTRFVADQFGSTGRTFEEVNDELHGIAERNEYPVDRERDTQGLGDYVTRALDDGLIEPVVLDPGTDNERSGYRQVSG